MRSRVLTVRDPASVDFSAYLKPFQLDQARLEREKKRAVHPFLRWEPGNVLAAGDIAVCRLVSDCPRFNREAVRFTAGSGLFHRQLEAQAIGMTVGQTCEVALPEGTVTMTLTQVTRRIEPPLTDALVEKMGLDGVHTVAQYTAYLIAQQKEEQFQATVYEPLHYLTRQVIDGSEFVLCQADWQHVVDLRLAQNRALCRQEGMTLETMTAKDFAGRIPVKCYDELVALEQTCAWDTLCLHLLGRWFARDSGEAPDQAGYADSIRSYMSSWGVTEAQAREVQPYENYAFFFYTGLANRVMYDIVKKQYDKED